MQSHDVRQTKGNGNGGGGGQNSSNTISGNASLTQSDNPSLTSPATSPITTPNSIGQILQSSFTPLSGPDSSTPPETSLLASSASAASAYSIPSPTFPVAASAHKHKLSPEAVAGTVLTIIILIFDRDAEMNREGRTISPFTLLVETNDATARDSDARGSKAGTIARQRLETQLRAATEKMVELEELADGSTTTHPNPGSRGGGEGGELVSPARASTAALPDLHALEAELRAAREQISMLVARINAMDSAWGMRIGGEPPPEYA
ncbi:hypothetical protein MSAN_01097200 [Mycena sanguinolenta]|uniref:Uncharacterized protein n=1 Tax=Mycena sanguinolenta TaxID=230812 RepID=A0A8H6YSG3_9AGAR|nr:hypothetical protein MSAN_01097200 [Mycena sanguinolenta]